MCVKQKEREHGVYKSKSERLRLHSKGHGWGGQVGVGERWSVGGRGEVGGRAGIIVLNEGLSDVRKKEKKEFRFHMSSSRVVGFRGSAMRRLASRLGSVVGSPIPPPTVVNLSSPCSSHPLASVGEA